MFYFIRFRIQMKIGEHKRTVSVCKFGTGGDYITAWPDEGLETTGYQGSRLKAFFETLFEIAGIILTGKTQNFLFPCVHRKQPGAFFAKGRGIGSPKTSEVYASTSVDITSKSRISAQRMLFADDCGACRTVGHKPKRRVRAPKLHRVRITKRRPAYCFPGQGNLFETDTISANLMNPLRRTA